MSQTTTVTTFPEVFAAAAQASPLRHLRLAQNHVLPNESLQDFEELVDALITRHRPFDQTETSLVEAIAGHHWTLIRIARLLRRDHEHSQQPQCADLRRIPPSSIERLQRFRKSARKSLNACRRALEFQQSARLGIEVMPYVKPISKTGAHRAPAK